MSSLKITTKSKTLKNISLATIIALTLIFIYILVKAIIAVDKRNIGTSSGIYTNRVTTDKKIYSIAQNLTKNCSSDICKVQRVLNFVTHIPYKINTFYANSPLKTIEQNYGDCDDKSNLLISLLNSLNYESYLLLLPKHIVVITHLKDKRLSNKKGLWLNGKKYYILESTAKNSPIGYPLKYKIDEIDSIINPFNNRKVDLQSISYGY
jgi:hypothetical protein